MANFGWIGFSLLFTLFSACAPKPAEIPDDRRISVTIERSVGRLRMQVLVLDCSLYEDVKRCGAGTPIERVPIKVCTPDDTKHELGLTGSEGRIDIRFEQIDPLFAVASTGKHQNAPLLVGKREVAFLPVGEIVHRQEVLVATIGQAEDLLAMTDADFESDTWWWYAQNVLNQMIDLQMRGEGSAELIKLTERLHDRIRRADRDTWFGERWWRRVKELFFGPDEDEIPKELMAHLRDAGDGEEQLATRGLGVPLAYLHTICRVTIGATGAAAMNLANISGVPGLVLSLITGVVGNEIEESLVQSCCKSASDFLTGQEAQKCPDDIRGG